MVDTIIAVDIAIIPMFTIIVLMSPSRQITNQLINTLLGAIFIPWIARISSSVWLAAIIRGLAIITHATGENTRFLFRLFKIKTEKKNFILLFSLLLIILDQHHSWTVSMVGDRIWRRLWDLNVTDRPSFCSVVNWIRATKRITSSALIQCKSFGPEVKSTESTFIVLHRDWRRNRLQSPISTSRTNWNTTDKATNEVSLS